MNHPDELLAEYVDGTLRGRDLEIVRSHLAECRRCREEAPLASAANRALAGMPAPAVPAGLGDAALRAARERLPSAATDRARRAPTWYRWVGAAAAAAAVLVVVALLLPGIGQGPSGASSAARGAASADLGGPLTLEVQRTNYDTTSLQALGVAVGAAQTAGGNPPAVPQEATAGLATGSPSPGGTSSALACVDEAWPTLSGQDPVRLIAARFEGKPAYLALYLHGPGAGEPPDLLTITVTYSATCTFGPTFAHQLG
ncbi:MAG: zf-HC2 domain-containing protein [Planctomycetaceae bacterium]